ncbi:MAG: hypothetical protein EOP38_24425 [Rubrivivax sp.]|nr:MAG: hypothetical protein EOP38_24425 [Rubrivivax sp.]
MRTVVVAGLAALMLALGGCANVQKKAFNKEAASHVQRVAVAEQAGKETYSINIIAHPGMNFGLLGGLVAAADLSSKSSTLTAALKPEQTAIRQRMARKLAESLKTGGYETQVMPLAEGVEFKRAFDSVRANLKDDALVTLDIQAGYVAAGPGSDYLPFVRVEVLHTEAKSGDLLYQDTITYGYTFENAKTVHLTSPAQYRFKNMDDLTARTDLAREGLYAGLDLIVAQISSDLKR